VFKLSSIPMLIPSPSRRNARTTRTWLLLGTAVVTLAGCTDKPSAPPSSAGRMRLELLRPVHGDTLAGEILCVAAWEGPAPPLGVCFLADGVPIDTVTAPPWEALWRPRFPPPGGTSHTLRAQAWTLDGARIEAAEVSVWVVPDSAPSVTFDPLPRTIWLHRDQAECIRARACDPEDGPIPGEAIVWTGSHLTDRLTGDCLPLTLLPDSDQTVTASARDSRGQEGSATLRLRPFRPLDPDEPEHCRFNLEAALQALDANLLEAQLAPGFIFVPCRSEAERAGWRLAWQRDEFLGAIRAWTGGQPMRRPEWTWEPGPMMIWTTDDGRQAWQQCLGTRLALRDSDSLHTEPVLLARGEAALWMAEDARGKWRILEWRDLPYDNETSLASVLAASAGMSVPGPGPGCARAPSPCAAGGSPRP